MLGNPTDLVHRAISLLAAATPLEQEIFNFYTFPRHGVNNLLNPTQLPDFKKNEQCKREWS